MKIKVDIFSGFLGAGKTMLIRKLIDEKLYKNKIVIIENEFGEVGIDGVILKKCNLAVKEINAGCICCTVTGDFTKAIEEAINQYDPERIIIEPSGVGKLSEIISLCKSQKMRNLVQVNMIITVVDALKYYTYIKNFSEFYKNQIINAKSIVLSKTQKLDKTSIDRITEDIRKLNKNAVIATTPWDKLKGDKIISISENSSQLSFEEQMKKFKTFAIRSNIKLRNTGTTVSYRHNADEIFQTWGTVTSKIFSIDRIKHIFKKMEEEGSYGNILRAKGIIQVNEREWVQFDYVPGELETKKIDADYSGRLCVIGSNLNKNMLYKIFIE